MLRPVQMDMFDLWKPPVARMPRFNPYNDGVTRERMEHIIVQHPKGSNVRLIIHVSKGISGNWYSSKHIHTSDSGSSSLAFPRFSHGTFLTRAAAIQSAVERILDYFSRDPRLYKPREKKDALSAISDFIKRGAACSS